MLSCPTYDYQFNKLHSLRMLAWTKHELLPHYLAPNSLVTSFQSKAVYYPFNQLNVVWAMAQCIEYALDLARAIHLLLFEDIKHQNKDRTPNSWLLIWEPAKYAYLNHQMGIPKSTKHFNGISKRCNNCNSYDKLRILKQLTNHTNKNRNIRFSHNEMIQLPNQSSVLY